MKKLAAILFVLLASVLGLALWKFDQEQASGSNDEPSRSVSAKVSGTNHFEDVDEGHSTAGLFESDGPIESASDTQRTLLDPTDLFRFTVRASGRPLEGAVVRCYTFLGPTVDLRTDGARLDSVRENPTAELVTDSSGRVLFPDLSFPIVVVVRAPDLAPASCVLKGLRAGLGIELSPGIPLRGKVVDARGNPVSGTVLHLEADPIGADDDEEDLEKWARQLMGCSAVTAESGDFTMDLRPDRAHWLHVLAGDLWMRPWVYSERTELVVRLPGPRRVEGRISDPDGEPLAGAEVQIDQRGPGEIANQHAMTDENGEFSFTSAPEGPALLVAFQKGWAAEKLLFGEEGLPEWIDVTLTPEVRLEGVVVDDRGEIVPGADVQFLDCDIGKDIGTMVSEDDGSFYMHWLHPDRHAMLIALADGYDAVELGPFVPSEMTEEERSSLRVALPRWGTIRGRVVDEAGRPVPRFQVQEIPEVTSRSLERDYYDRDRWFPFDSEDGRFEISPTRATTFHVTVEAEGFERAVLEGLAVPPGGTNEECVITLSRAVPVLGRVVDESGQGIAGARETLLRQDFTGEWLAAGTTHQATSDGAGEFQLGVAGHERFALLVEHAARGRRIFADLDIADFPRSFTLPRPGTLAGRVHLPWSNQSFALVRIHTEGLVPPLDLVPGENGEFTSPPLSPGWYRVELFDLTLRAERGIQEGLSRRVRVEAGDVTRLELCSAPAGRIDGWLTGDEPLDGLRVRVLRAEDHEVVAYASVLAVGGFTVGGLPFGHYEVQAMADEPGLALLESKPVDLSADSPVARVNLSLESASLRGRVTDRSGNPLVADLWWLDEDGDPAGRTRTSSAGEYRLCGLDLDDTKLEISAPGFAALIVDAAEWKHRSQDLRHVLEPEARIRVNVVDDRGAPVAGATVYCESKQGPPLESISGREPVVFSRRPAGTYTLHARHRDLLPGEAQECRLSSGETRDVTLILLRPAMLEVWLVDGRGDARREKVVQLVAVTGEDASRLERTDDEGLARFTRLAPGSYRFVVDGVEEAITLAAGEHAERRISGN